LIVSEVRILAIVSYFCKFYWMNCYSSVTILLSWITLFLRPNVEDSRPGVNFINLLHARFSYKSALRSFSLITFWQKKHFPMKNARLKCWWNWLQKVLCRYFVTRTGGQFKRSTIRKKWTTVQKGRYASQGGGWWSFFPVCHATSNNLLQKLHFFPEHKFSFILDRANPLKSFCKKIFMPDSKPFYFSNCYSFKPRKPK